MSEDALSVDPDGLKSLASPYEAAAADFKRLHARVRDLRSRYQDAWGHDDMGNQFGKQFTSGLDGVETRAENLGRTLAYFGDGLYENGTLFQDADDNALEVSHTLYHGIDELNRGPQVASSVATGPAALMKQTVEAGSDLPGGAMAAEGASRLEPVRGYLLPSVPALPAASAGTDDHR